MPTDNLTLKLKQQLSNAGLEATDDEINQALKQIQMTDNDLPNNQLSNNMTTSQTQPMSGGLPNWLSEPESSSSDSKINLLEGVGAATWNFFDTAAFSLPGIISRRQGVEDIFGLELDPEKRGPAGKVGGVIGEAAGFLLPMKWISKGVGYGVKSLSSKGGKKVVDDIINSTGKYNQNKDSIYSIGNSLGFKDKAALKGALGRTFKSSDEAISRGVASYGVSGEAIAQSKSVLKSTIGTNLKEAFPEMGARQIDELAEAVTIKLGAPGLHINSVGNWIQRVVNKKIGLDDQGKISKYITHAGEMTTNFTMYNILTNGVHALAGEADFDPAQSAYDALLFSAFLPFVENIPGGGKIPIYSTGKKILEYTRKGFKKVDYNKYSDESLNGLLQVVGNGTHMSKAPFWEKAYRNSGGKLDRETAIGALETIRKTADLDNIWRDFAKSAGSDLVSSIGRMTAGAFYFNSHTLLDKEMIRNVDPEVLGAHMLVGAFFTKMRKPIFEKQNPYLENFPAKVELLRNFGIDATVLEANNRYFTAKNMLAGAQSGSLTNEKISRIYDIIYDPINMSEQKSRKNIGKEIGFDINNPEYNIVRQSKELADIRRFNQKVKEGEPENLIELNQLTKTQADKIKEQLENLIINKEKGIKLTEENFDDFYLDIQNELQISSGRTIVNRLVEIAKELGIATEGKASEFNFDKQNIRIADIDGTSTSTNLQAIVSFQQILNRFKSNGSIGSFEPFTGKTYEQFENDPKLIELNKKVQSQLDLMVKELKQGNFNEGVYVDIDPTNNAFLDLFDGRASYKTLTTMYDIIKGRNLEKEGYGNIIKSMRRSTLAILGDKLPSLKSGVIREMITIDAETKPENMKDDTWTRIKAEELNIVEKDLQTIAKIWATENKNTKPDYIKQKISYEDAKALVEVYKNQYPKVFKDNFVDKINNYHYQREFKDIRLGNRESGILSFATTHNILQRDQASDSWTIMDREGVAENLDQKGIPRGTKEHNDLLNKFDKIREALARIDGKYINFVNHLEKAGANESDIEGFIKNSYPLTVESVSSVMRSYENIIAKTSKQGENIQLGQSIIDKLYDAELESIKKLSLEETMEIKLEIKNLLNNSKNTKKESSIDSAFVSYFERLVKQIDSWQKGKKTEEFSSSERNYIDGNELIIGRARKLSELQKQIMKIQLLSTDTLRGQRNSARMKDEIVAKISNQLKELKIEIGKEKSLEELYEWYGLGNEIKGLSVENFIAEFKTKNFAFENNMSKDQYEMLRQSYAKSREAFDSNFDQTPKLTYQSLENKYGEFNENLRGDKYESLKENIITSIKEKKGVREQSNILINEVHKAIESMNTLVEGPMTVEQLNKIRNQKIKFNERFSGLLAQSYGTETVKHISFSENGLLKGNQVELIIEGKTESSGANSFFQRNLFETTGASLYNVGKNSVYGNKTFSDFSDIPLPESRKNKLFENPERVKEEGEPSLGRFRGVKITVSQWDQIFLRTDNFTKNNNEIAIKFKNKFNDWYDNIFSKLTDNQSKANFERMYKHIRESDFIVLGGPLREMIKAQYWSNLSESAFIENIKAANTRQDMNNLSVGLLKYFHYMRTAGAQIKGSKEFLNTMFNIAKEQKKENGFWWDTRNNIDHWSEIEKSIMDYNKKPKGFNVLSVKDDSGTGGLSAYSITKEQYKKRLAKSEKGTDEYKALQESIAELDKGDKGKFASILASGMDAQSWLSTDAANIVYLHRGRTIYDDLAGIKPTGWSNTNDILLKTNFIHDRSIGDLLKRAGIDILTTESAAKRFGAGHTELKKADGKLLEAKDYSSYLDAFTKSQESLTNGIKSNLKIEDIYMGKTTDRHLTNVSYAATNFLDAIGYNAFTKDIGYYKKIPDAIGRYTHKISNSKATERNAEFLNELRMSRENGDIFADGTSGSIDRLIRSGVDVQSNILLPDVQRIVVRRILGEISKPKTPWGSHSVLVPYLEGTAPLYATLKDKNGKEVKRQIAYGGKKLSYFDGQLEVSNFKDLKFIVEHKDLQGSKQKYDIQIGYDSDGKLIVHHPVTGNKIPKSLKSAIEKRLETVRNVISRNNSDPTMKIVYELLNTLNNTASKISHGKKSYSDIKMFLHSLSLRVPNIGGDVAVHKVEGFYEKELGNIVGINPMDLSVKHQGDFDVDMAHSYHKLPWDMIMSITENMAKTPDAKVYPAAPKDFDMFNMGSEIGPVGKNENTDSLEPHYNNYRNAQGIFGSVMNIAPGIGALERIGFKINNEKSMMDLQGNKFVPIKQRLKNVLQSIIDSTKTSNFASLGSREEVLKFVLFGRDFNKSQDQYRLSEYGETGINEGKWSGLFKLPKEIKGNQRLVLEDAIIQALNIVNMSNRVLSGVSDPSGRRPPDLAGMMSIRNKINKFLKDPGSTLFNDLLFQYKVADPSKKDLQSDLIELFYGVKEESYKNQKELMKDLYSKKMITPKIKNTNLFTINRDSPKDPRKEISNGEKNIHKIGVGGIIMDMFGTNLGDKTKWVKKAYSQESKKAYNLLEKIEASFLLGNSENLQELLSQNKVRESFAEITSGADTYSKFGEIFNELTTYNINKIQNYSILNHVVDKESSQLRNFINSNSGNKYKSNSLIRAQFKLKTLDIIKDNLLSREKELLESKDTKSEAYKYFKFTDYDLSRSKFGMNVNNSGSNHKYIYKLEKMRNGRLKYNFYGTISPKGYSDGKKFLRAGSKYVVMNNPIKYDLMSTRSIKDANALMSVVGESVAANIQGIKEGSIESFYDRLGQLKKDMYESTSETYKMSNKSAFARKNWSEQSKHEENLIRKFFEETRMDIAGEGQLTDQAVFTIAGMLIKPRQTSSLTKLSSTSPIAIPSYKINKRMFMAVERYLNSFGHRYKDVYDSIFKAYGNEYRKINDRIIDSKEELMYRSDLYQNGPLYPSRDSSLDLAFGTYGYLYIPSIMQSVRSNLKKYGGVGYKTHDAFGNVRRMINYENVGNHESMGKYYSTDKNFKDAVETKERCD